MNTPKVLGQSAPSTTTLTNLYTVPSSTNTVCSTLIVCNQGGSPSTFRISVAIGGAADSGFQYIAYDVAIAGNTTQAFTIGITLAATDVVRVYAGSGSFSFSLFGTEIT